MKLYYQTYFETLNPDQSDKSVIVIIPGLFGSTGNWRSFAKKLSQEAPVIVVDQRNHGQSPHSMQNGYFDCVSDLVELIDDLNLGVISLCGHSMGGKTAMVFALTQPKRVDHLMVLDIAPVAYAHSHAPILEALKSVDLRCVQSRSDVEKQLVDAIPDKATRMFMMLSLAGKKDEFFWRLNVDGLYSNLSLIGGFPTKELVNKVFEPACLFVKGRDSDYVESHHYAAIERFFPANTIMTVENAGHWLHVDQQQAVIETITCFLQNESQ